jgi:hypothetical protein
VQISLLDTHSKTSFFHSFYSCLTYSFEFVLWRVLEYLLLSHFDVWSPASYSEMISFCSIRLSGKLRFNIYRAWHGFTRFPGKGHVLIFFIEVLTVTLMSLRVFVLEALRRETMYAFEEWSFIILTCSMVSYFLLSRWVL